MMTLNNKANRPFTRDANRMRKRRQARTNSSAKEARRYISPTVTTICADLVRLLYTALCHDVGRAVNEARTPLVPANLLASVKSKSLTVPEHHGTKTG